MSYEKQGSGYDPGAVGYELQGRAGPPTPPKPVRIQLSRAKGWRMPPDTVKVDRSTRWGNPFVRGVAGVKDNTDAVQLYRCLLAGYLPLCAGPDIPEMRGIRRYVNGQIHRLRGKNLACWCKIGAPCHADVLLELANG